MYERRSGSVFGAFLLGGMLGAILGLLFAPRTGEETREMLTARANDYWGQAGDVYSAGLDKVTEAVDTNVTTAEEKSEQLRTKIDEARARLQEQVAKSADMAKDKIVEVAPTVKDVVDKAAAGAKTGVDMAADRASEGLGYVARSFSSMDAEPAAEEATAEEPAATEDAAAEAEESPAGKIPEV